MVSESYLRLGVKSRIRDCPQGSTQSKLISLYRTRFLRRFVLEIQPYCMTPNGSLMYSVHVGNGWQQWMCCHDSMGGRWIMNERRNGNLDPSASGVTRSI